MIQKAKKLWGDPPKIRGAYERADYAPGRKFGPREAGSVVDDAAWTALVIAPIAYEIEMLAQRADIGLPPGVAGFASGFGAFVMKVILKIIANYLRRNGASLLRDLGAWLYERIVEWLGWDSSPDPDKPGLFKRFFSKFRRRRRRRRVVRRVIQ